MNTWLKNSILLAGLTLVTAGPALADHHEEDGAFSFGTDVVSRYVWRGLDFGDGLSLQPYIAYTRGPLEIGAWGSFGVTSNGANESDLYIAYSTGPLGIILTDYFFPSYRGNDSFLDYSDKGGHTIELAVTFDQGPISLMGAINVLETQDGAGDTQNSLYLQAGYGLGEIGEVDVSLVAGVGNEDYTSDTDPNLINAGINLSKDDFWAQYLVNLDRETSYLVFGWTFF